jgi:putative tricarboxylic transport membrane protein
MRLAEQIACFFWVALAMAVCWGSFNLKLGTPSDPGSGFLPFGTGLILGIMALGHWITVTFRQRPKEDAAGFIGEVNWKRSLWVVGSLLAYVLLLPYLGYLLTTFLLMLILFSVYERKKWWILLIMTLLVSGVSYGVFHNWLKVQFPLGLWGIG